MWLSTVGLEKLDESQLLGILQYSVFKDVRCIANHLTPYFLLEDILGEGGSDESSGDEEGDSDDDDEDDDDEGDGGEGEEQSCFILLYLTVACACVGRVQ